MKIVSLKRKSIPKVAVLATALAVGFMAATVDMRPAQANPSQESACTACHSAAGGSTTAVPSDPGPDAGAAYTVLITITATNTGNTGYWIDGPGGSSGGGSTAALTYTVDMVAPATTGPQLYTVWTNADNGTMAEGQASSATYTIDVGPAAPTTAPATTAPATTAPATTAPATTAPATTASATTAPATVAPAAAAAVVPVGGPATGAGGAAQSNGSPLMGFGGLALLLSGAAMVTAIRRRRQV